jgi:hypothetical protein
MLNLNFFYHVVREHFFCNSYYFYRFNKVMRSVKQIKKKRFSSSSSSRGSVSYFESVTTGSKSSSQLDGILSPGAGGGGRLGEHYCVCDLYPRQSEILSQSTENLTLLVDEINSMYSSQSLGSQESQGEGARGEEEGGEVSDLKVDQEDDGTMTRPAAETTKEDRLRSHSSGGSHQVDDWKIGSLDSQGSGPLLERGADGEENHR